MRRFLTFYADIKAPDSCCVSTQGLWADAKSDPHFGNRLQSAGEKVLSLAAEYENCPRGAQ